MAHPWARRWRRPVGQEAAFPRSRSCVGAPPGGGGGGGAMWRATGSGVSLFRVHEAERCVPFRGGGATQKWGTVLGVSEPVAFGRAGAAAQRRCSSAPSGPPLGPLRRPVERNGGPGKGRNLRRRNRAPGRHANRNAMRRVVDGLRTEVCGQQEQSNDPGNNQHNPQYANYWAPLTRKRHIPPHPAQPRHTNHWAP